MPFLDVYFKDPSSSLIYVHGHIGGWENCEDRRYLNSESS